MAKKELQNNEKPRAKHFIQMFKDLQNHENWDSFEGQVSETLTEEEARIRDEGADAMKSGAYDTATEVIEFAKQLLAFQGKVAALADEWEQIENARDTATLEVQEIVSKKFFGKKRKGTHQRSRFRGRL